MQTCLAVFLRGLLRRLGLTAYAKWAGLWLGLPSEDDLERVVDNFLTATIRPGDVVWDVGANRGRQTRLLSRLVGREGLVVSIEPEAANMGHLASAVWSAPNIALVNAALSDTDGRKPSSYPLLTRRAAHIRCWGRDVLRQLARPSMCFAKILSYKSAALLSQPSS